MKLQFILPFYKIQRQIVEKYEKYELAFVWFVRRKAKYDMIINIFNQIVSL